MLSTRILWVSSRLRTVTLVDARSKVEPLCYGYVRGKLSGPMSLEIKTPEWRFFVLIIFRPSPNTLAWRYQVVVYYLLQIFRQLYPEILSAMWNE